MEPEQAGTMHPAPTDLILPWLPRERLQLHGLGQVVQSVERVDGYDIECRFDAEPGGALNYKRSIFAPLEQLALLKPGSIFEEQRLVGSLDTLAPRQATSILPWGDCALDPLGDREFRINDEVPLGSPPRTSRTLAPRYVVFRGKNRRIYIPCAEMLRFYFGSLSLVASRLFGAEPGDGLVEPAETRFLDERTYQIAPIAELADRGSALHLAMILTAPDLIHAWQQICDGYVVAGARNQTTYFPELSIGEAEQSFALVGQTYEVTDVFNVRNERSFVAWSITSDYRRPAFDRLVIKLPRGAAPAELNESAADAAEAVRHENVYLSDELKSRRRPGHLARKFSAHHDAVTRAFPGLSRVPVTFASDQALSRSAATEYVAQRREIEELSAAPGKGAASVGGIVMRPSFAGAFPEHHSRPQSRFFDDSVPGELHLTRKTKNELVYPLPAFVGAMTLLARHNRGALIYQDAMWALGEVSVVQPDLSWGAAARGRVFAVGRIDVDGRSAYVFELSRRAPNERISLGVVARADGEPLSGVDVARVCRYAIRQISMRGRGDLERSRGVWPDSTAFFDVAGRNISHTARRRVPGILAEDLDAAASVLFPHADAAGKAA